MKVILSVCMVVAIAAIVRASPPLPCDQSAQSYVSCSAPWEHSGPNTYQQQGTLGRTGIRDMSAVENVVSLGNGTVFIGSVNGGIWRTWDVTANNYQPSWEVVRNNFLQQPCIYIDVLLLLLPSPFILLYSTVRGSFFSLFAI